MSSRIWMKAFWTPLSSHGLWTCFRPGTSSGRNGKLPWPSTMKALLRDWGHNRRSWKLCTDTTRNTEHRRSSPDSVSARTNGTFPSVSSPAAGGNGQNSPAFWWPEPTCFCSTSQPTILISKRWSGWKTSSWTIREHWFSSPTIEFSWTGSVPMSSTSEEANPFSARRPSASSSSCRKNWRSSGNGKRSG